LERGDICIRRSRALRFARESTARFLTNDTVIGGEIIVYGTDGRDRSTSCGPIAATGPERHLHAFDLFTLRGTALTREPLEEGRDFAR
jgi:hypothetical protein